MSRLSYSRWERKAKHRLKDIRKIKEFVLESDLDCGKKSVMLRLVNYVLDSKKRKNSRIFKEGDYVFELLLLRVMIPTELDLVESIWAGPKVVEIYNRKEEDDEPLAVQSA